MDACITSPLLLSAEQAAELCGISRSTLLRMDRTGELGPRSLKLRGRRLFRRADLDDWVAGGCKPRVEFLRGKR